MLIPRVGISYEGEDMTTNHNTIDLADALASWLRTLAGERKSPATIRGYRVAVEAFLVWCAGDANASAELTKPNVIAWLAAQHDASSATVRLRLTAVKQFAKWLAAEEGFDADPILAVRAPKLTQAPVADLSDNEIARMVKAAAGARLRDKRDRAMILLLAETGLRAAELLGLEPRDVDLDRCTLLVRHGKGGKPRRVRFSASTAAAVDRYTRARRTAVRRPAEGALWVSERGAPLSYHGLATTLKERAEDAGVIGFHVHRLRHSAAVRWLRAGGSETGLMAQAGWASRDMIGRYVATASEQLAAEEFDRLGLAVREL
jgi:site-specific recombinase XerD